MLCETIGSPDECEQKRSAQKHNLLLTPAIFNQPPVPLHCGDILNSLFLRLLTVLNHSFSNSSPHTCWHLIRRSGCKVSDEELSTTPILYLPGDVHPSALRIHGLPDGLRVFRDQILNIHPLQTFWAISRSCDPVRELPIVDELLKLALVELVFERGAAALVKNVILSSDESPLFDDGSNGCNPSARSYADDRGAVVLRQVDESAFLDSDRDLIACSALSTSTSTRAHRKTTHLYGGKTDM